MKIGILTFHCANNYGAVLQTYGLQEYLKTLGHDVYVIDYRPNYILKAYPLFDWKWSHIDWKSLSMLLVKDCILYFIRSVLAFPIRMRRRLFFSLFRYKYIRLCSNILSDSNSDFDAFIFGSDQIWNPLITAGGFDINYFAHFPAAKNKRLVSYAGSVGSLQNLKSKECDFISLLSSYTSISVREKSLADLISKLAPEKCAKTVLDPVLLAGRKVFETIASKKTHQKKYLLVFQLAFDDTLTVQRIAERIAQDKKLEIKYLISEKESLKDCSIKSSVSISDFIALFRDASYVITTSYHGTVFAIIFEREFNVVNLNDKINERMTDLLSLLDLKERILTNADSILYNGINYDKVNSILKEKQLTSQSFIKNSLD